jgi:hypothetical protein
MRRDKILLQNELQAVRRRLRQTADAKGLPVFLEPSSVSGTPTRFGPTRSWITAEMRRSK